VLCVLPWIKGMSSSDRFLVPSREMGRAAVSNGPSSFLNQRAAAR
jgi:hypothetical protein